MSVYLCACSSLSSVSYKADDEALSIIQNSDDAVINSYDTFIEFMPYVQPKIGLIYYCDENIEAESFSWVANEIADSGFLVLLVRTPNNEAISADTISELQGRYPYVHNWCLSGFGNRAEEVCKFTIENDGIFLNVILYAGAPSSDTDISLSSLNVLLIHGSVDGIYTPQIVEEAKAYLPQNTDYYNIGGANHTQFGMLNNNEPIKSDNEAEIKRIVQQRIIADQTIAFLKNIE